MSEQHQAPGSQGGNAIVAKYGREYMRELGRKGGRPRLEVSIQRAWDRHDEAQRRARERVLVHK